MGVEMRAMRAFEGAWLARREAMGVEMRVDRARVEAMGVEMRAFRAFGGVWVPPGGAMGFEMRAFRAFGGAWLAPRVGRALVGAWLARWGAMGGNER